MSHARMVAPPCYPFALYRGNNCHHSIFVCCDTQIYILDWQFVTAYHLPSLLMVLMDIFITFVANTRHPDQADLVP